MFGAGISLDVAEGTFLVDGDGVRFGLGSTPSESLPLELKYISQFATPALNASSNAYGLAKTDGDFLVEWMSRIYHHRGSTRLMAALQCLPLGWRWIPSFNLMVLEKSK